MSPGQLRYFIGQNGLGAALVNALLNGGIGWLMMLKQHELASWGMPSVASDLVATCFGVAFGTALIVPITTRLDLQRGKVSAPPLSAAHSALLARLPSGHMARACVLGALGVLVFAPPALGLLSALAPAVMSGNDFIAVKALVSAIEGALVTPLIAVAAIIPAAHAENR